MKSLLLLKQQNTLLESAILQLERLSQQFDLVITVYNSLLSHKRQEVHSEFSQTINTIQTKMFTLKTQVQESLRRRI